MPFYFFTILKGNFIIYNISFYNALYIKKFYYFIFLLKYYFLIFFIIPFPTSLFFRIPKVTFSWASELFLFFFQTCILQQSHFPSLCNTIFFSNSDVDSSGLPLAFIISFQQWCFFKWRHRDTENEKREGNRSTRQWREKFQEKKKMK